MVLPFRCVSLAMTVHKSSWIIEIWRMIYIPFVLSWPSLVTAFQDVGSRAPYEARSFSTSPLCSHLAPEDPYILHKKLSPAEPNLKAKNKHKSRKSAGKTSDATATAWIWKCSRRKIQLSTTFTFKDFVLSSSSGFGFSFFHICSLFLKLYQLSFGFFRHSYFVRDFLNFLLKVLSLLVQSTSCLENYCWITLRMVWALRISKLLHINRLKS